MDMHIQCCCWTDSFSGILNVTGNVCLIIIESEKDKISAMIPCERMRNAMTGGTVDRTPVMCQPAWGHILLNSKIDPVDLWHEPEAYAKGLLWIQRNYQFDGILMSVNGFDSQWRKSILKTKRDSDGTMTIDFKDGTKISYPKDDLPFSAGAVAAHADFQSFEVDLISTDIPTYLPVSQGLKFRVSSIRDERQFLTRYLKEQTKGESSLHGEVYSPFDYFLDLFGLENSLMNLILDAAKCREVISRFTEGNIKYVKEMIEGGCDAIKISSPYAGQGFISRQMYVDFVQPFESKIAQVAKQCGAAVYVHTCGAIDDRLELMRDAGFSGIECLDPPPLGNVELADAVQRIGKDLFIKGNIDSVNMLLANDAAACKADAIERIRIGKQAKGFILSTACSIAPHVKPENVAVLYDAVEETCRY